MINIRCDFWSGKCDKGIEDCNDCEDFKPNPEWLRDDGENELTDELMTRKLEE